MSNHTSMKFLESLSLFDGEAENVLFEAMIGNPTENYYVSVERGIEFFEAIVEQQKNIIKQTVLGLQRQHADGEICIHVLTCHDDLALEIYLKKNLSARRNDLNQRLARVQSDLDDLYLIKEQIEEELKVLSLQEK